MSNSNMAAQGINDALELVKSYTESLRTVKSLFELIEEALEDVASIAVDTQTSAIDGSSYNPLKPSTQEITGKGPNQALKNSHMSSQRIVKFDRLGTKDATIGISLPYAGVHQHGAPNNTFYGNKAPIPARPILPLDRQGNFTPEFQQRLETITLEWLETKTRNRGGR